MYIAVVCIIIFFLIASAISCLCSIPEFGPIGLLFAIIFFGLGIYLGVTANKCDKLRLKVLVDTKPVVIIDDYAYISQGGEMVNMSHYFKKNIAADNSVNVFEWNEKGGWITFDKSTEYELVTKTTN